MGEQANLFKANLDYVWEQFLAKTKWDEHTVTEERQALTQAIEEAQQQAEQLAAKIRDLTARVEGLSTRRNRAKEHLETAAKKMGIFGTEAVLLVSLLEAFPPFEGQPAAEAEAPAEPERPAPGLPEVHGRHTGHADMPVDAPAPPEAPKAKVKEVAEALARADERRQQRVKDVDAKFLAQHAQKVEPAVLTLIVLEVLDHEGMTAGEILKLIRKHPKGDPEITAENLAKVTAGLAKQGMIEVEGERRAKVYRLAQHGDMP